MTAVRPTPAAIRPGEVDSGHLAALNAGTAEARTLSEALAIDHVALLTAAAPGAPAALREAAAQAQQLGILKRMAAIGGALRAHVSPATLASLETHPSDTVRGWWCFAVAADPACSPRELLERLRSRADDSCFTVREWVWMAARPRLLDDLAEAVTLLTPWTLDPAAHVRRFASEALRPRGVWATHIAEFKAHPELGEPLLEPLRADPSTYVQESVANWINDASKSAPKWARQLCARWITDSPSPATARIVKRALRTIGQTE